MREEIKKMKRLTFRGSFTIEGPRPERGDIISFTMGETGPFDGIYLGRSLRWWRRWRVGILLDRDDAVLFVRRRLEGGDKKNERVLREWLALWETE